MLVTLTLEGNVPSKKNSYDRKAGGRGLFLPAKVTKAIDSLIVQAQSQWCGRKPIIHPNLNFRFYVKDGRADRDNKLGCLFDVLQKAGVLKTDSIAQCNGRLVIEPAQIDADERTVITISAEAQP